MQPGEVGGARIEKLREAAKQAIGIITVDSPDTVKSIADAEASLAAFVPAKDITTTIGANRTQRKNTRRTNRISRTSTTRHPP